MASKVMGLTLEKALFKQGLNQKYVAIDSNTPQSTFSDHVKGKKPVEIGKAVDYAESLNDSMFNLEVARMFFGTISAMTGDRYQNNPLALDIIQQVESNERKAKKDRALEILAVRDLELSDEDREVILDYASEYLDEIMVETTMLVSLLDTAGVTLMGAVSRRMPYWQQKGYMRKE